MYKKFLKWLLPFYRRLPLFKGKLVIGKMIFRQLIGKKHTEEVIANDGIRYLIPDTREIIGVELLINGVFEKKILQLILANIKDGDNYFDVGANIGTLGIPIISKRKLNYHAFEASQTTVQFLKKNLELNRMENYHVVNAAVYETGGGEIDFYLSDEYGKSTLSGTYYNNTVKVPTVSIGEYCLQRGIERIHVLKADVQGFEYFVFAGMAQMLREKRVDNLFFEYAGWAENDAGLKKGAAQDFLWDAGYSLFTIEGKELIRGQNHQEDMIWAKISAR